MSTQELLKRTAELAGTFIDGLPERHVGGMSTLEGLKASLDTSLPEGPREAAAVIEQLAGAVDAGLVATAGPRFFGFVNGGSLPAALAADVLTSAWDQNCGLVIEAPAEALVEEITGRWLAELLDLPAGVSCGFVTGGTMANFACLAAARHHALARTGWDVESDGLVGAPAPTVMVGEERHVSIDVALRYLGLGSSRSIVLPADDQGRMSVEGLKRALDDTEGPAIVCAQAGNVNTGAVDPLRDVCAVARDHSAWVHVDGAFGMWAAAAPRRKHLIDGVRLADSWASDAHKWLNVPYDCGMAFCAHPAAHRAALGIEASYFTPSGAVRDPMDYTPESSRRGRAFPVYAALRSLGRSGVAELVERCCAHAAHFAQILGEQDDITVLNAVVLNQVLVRFGDDDATTREVIRRVQEDGTCWLGGADWKGKAVMRISVSNWSTTPEDVEMSAKAILRSYRSLRSA